MIVLREAKLSLRWKTTDRVDFDISEFAMSELICLSEPEEFSRGGRFQYKTNPLLCVLMLMNH